MPVASPTILHCPSSVFSFLCPFSPVSVASQVFVMGAWMPFHGGSTDGLVVGIAFHGSGTQGSRGC